MGFLHRSIKSGYQSGTRNRLRAAAIKFVALRQAWKTRQGKM
jgi:hypothetical protein